MSNIAQFRRPLTPAAPSRPTAPAFVRWADYQALLEANDLLEKLVDTQRKQIGDLQSVVDLQAGQIRSGTEAMTNAIALMQKKDTV
jgi:hypothetical protein